MRALHVAPAVVDIPDDNSPQQLSVGGLFSDGRFRNLTSSASGTGYRPTDPLIATASSEGMVSGVAGGVTEVIVQNSGVSASARVQVQLPSTLIAFEPASPGLTLVSVGVEQPLEVLGRFTDRSTRPAQEIAGTSFLTSDATIVDVTSAGAVRGLANGVAEVRVLNGAVSAGISVAVELRTPPAVTGISIQPVPRITTDDSRVDLEARVLGTGSLEGIDVSFTIAGDAPVGATTSRDGTAGAAVTVPATRGTFTVVAAVVDPATQSRLTAETLLTVGPGTNDQEPNDTDENASRLGLGRAASGSLDGTADSRDVFLLDVEASGTLTFDLQLAGGLTQGHISIVVRNAQGVEIGRFNPIESTSQIAVPASAGGTFVSIESSAAGGSYSLWYAFRQSALTLAAVTPSSGAPGTLVTIAGTGFSDRIERNFVFFGGIPGKVLAASSNQLQVQVPADGINGPIEIVSGASHFTGPTFSTGIDNPPDDFAIPSDPNQLRQDPVSGHLVEVNRLLVEVDALATRAAVEALAASHGGSIAGYSR